MSVYDYDLFVIGGGSGGVRAARLAGAIGKRVGLAEEYRVGGTCVIRGCVPKKLFRYASGFSDAFVASEGFGWSLSDISFDWKQLVAGKDREIARLESLYRQNLERNHVVIYPERAVFLDRHHLQLVTTGKIISADKILIATGARPRKELFSGHEFCIHSDNVFDLETLPDSIVIAGGGYIAVEFASIFHGLGVKTSLVYRGELILRGFDRELAGRLQEAMIANGIDILCDATISQVTKQDVKKQDVTKQGENYEIVLSNGQVIFANQVMLALGRVPNSCDLGLDKAGVALNDQGAVMIDEYSRTTIENIWAIGDVTNQIQLTPVAIHEAMCFVKTVFENKPTVPDRDMVATAVFSQPEIGTVGYSEEQAVEKFAHIEIYQTSFRPLYNVLSPRIERVMLKLVVDGASRIVLGAHILGAEAGEMIQLLAIAIKGNVTKDVFDATMAVHPTIAEEFVTLYQPSLIYHNGKREVPSY